MKTYRKRKLLVITSVAGVPNIIIAQIMYVSLKFLNLIPVGVQTKKEDYRKECVVSRA